MRVLVTLKRVPDPYGPPIRINEDGLKIVSDDLKMVINPFDEIALEEAIRWKEQNIVSEIVVVSIGSEMTTQTLRAALALGADRGVLLKTDQILEPLNIAKVLTFIIKKEAPDIVMMGKQAIDNDSSQTGQMMAAMLNWPQATFASKIIFSDNQEKVIVTREIDGGLETLQATLPCVITADLRLNTPRYPSLPNIMKSKSKPIEIVAIPDTIDIRSRTKVLNMQSPLPRKPGIKVKDIAELLDYLRNTEKII